MRLNQAHQNLRFYSKLHKDPLHTLHIISSPEQRSRKAIVLPPASAAALRRRPQMLRFSFKFLTTSLFPNLIIDMIHLWYNDTYWFKHLRSTIPTTLGYVIVKVTVYRIFMLKFNVKAPSALMTVTLRSRSQT